MRFLFIYNEADLKSKTNGGVQLCSQEFLSIIREMNTELKLFCVTHSRSYMFRLLRKLNLDNYMGYNTDSYAAALKKTIVQHQITHVFINKAELLRFSKTIKQLELPNMVAPKVVIMSHGNESGDLLGELTEYQARHKGLLKLTGIIKLGLTLYTESFFRRRYVDLVCAMSEEESLIERWLGINHTFFIPRLIAGSERLQRNPIPGRFGYVGTLNHSPNLTAIKKLCDTLVRKNIIPELRIVGHPPSIGMSLELEYKFIKYMGPLTDIELFEEVKTWAYSINPIFNYSRGASMKLAKYIEWEIPVITTKAGRRGYIFKKGSLIETESNADAFAEAISNCINQVIDYNELVEQIIAVKTSSLTKFEVGEALKKQIELYHN